MSNFTKYLCRNDSFYNIIFEIEFLFYPVKLYDLGVHRQQKFSSEAGCDDKTTTTTTPLHHFRANRDDRTYRRTDGRTDGRTEGQTEIQN